MLSALFTHVAGRRLHVEEVACEGQGHDACQLLVVGGTRAAKLQELARKLSEPSQILEALETRDDG